MERSALERSDAWFGSRRGELVSSLRHTFEVMSADLDPADVAGLGVKTDTDALTLIAALQTRAHREAEPSSRFVPHRWDRDQYAYLLQAPFPHVFLDDVEHAGEVYLFEVGGISPHDTRPWYAWRDMALGHYAGALADLRAEGYFDRFSGAEVLLEVADSTHHDDERLLAWHRAANVAAVAADYEAWLRAR